MLVPVVGVIIHDSDRRVLLQRRGDGGPWGLLGGAMDLDERPEETARREIREEAGLELGVLKLVDVCAGPAFFHVYPNGDQVAFVMIIYETDEVNGSPIPDGEESISLAFLALDHLPGNLLPVARQVLERYQQRGQD